MRMGFVVLLLVLGGFAIGFSLLQQSEGYVLVAVAGYSIEMSFVVACILNVMVFVCFYFLWVTVRALLSSRRGILAWVAGQRRQRGLNHTTQGLIAFVEGRWDFARKSLAKSAKNSTTPLINYLFAARASSAMGDTKAVDGFLEQAELSTEGADVAIGLTQAELQVQNGQYEQALASLLRIKKKAGHHAVVLQLLARVYVELADWSNLLKLLPSLKHSGISEAKVLRYERNACCELLLKEAKVGDEKTLTACWKQLPLQAKKQSIIVACYAEQLVALNCLDEAELVLRNQLQRTYDSRLIKSYGHSVVENSAKQLAFTEKLLKTHGDDPDLLIALGTINLQLGKREQAKNYFKQSFAIKVKAESCKALAMLYAEEGSFQQSSELYAQAAAL